jgi:hypothetical protein
MRRYIQAGLFVTTTALCPLVVAAQDRPVEANDPSTMMVAGCVQRTEQSGTLGTTIPERTASPENAGTLANSGEPATGFILADAAADYSAGMKAGAPTDLPRRYVLIGNELDLAKHEGKRVRVNGKIVPSTKPPDKPVATSGADQIGSETPRLRVTSVEVIAGSCSQR